MRELGSEFIWSQYNGANWKYWVLSALLTWPTGQHRAVCRCLSNIIFNDAEHGRHEMRFTAATCCTISSVFHSAQSGRVCLSHWPTPAKRKITGYALWQSQYCLVSALFARKVHSKLRTILLHVEIQHYTFYFSNQPLQSTAQFSCFNQNTDYQFGLNPFLQRFFP